MTNPVKPLASKGSVPTLHLQHTYTLCSYNPSCNYTVVLHPLITDYMAQAQSALGLSS